MDREDINLVHISMCRPCLLQRGGYLDIELLVGLEHIYVVSSLALEADNQLDFN